MDFDVISRIRPDAHKRGEEVPAPKIDVEALEGGGDLVGLHGHKEQLIKLLLENNSGTMDVLVRGGSGMTTLVRKVCEDGRVRDRFACVLWISAPQINDYGMIHEEILLQLLFPSQDNSDTDHQEVKYFTNSSERNEKRCLIVIDNLVDMRNQRTLQQVSRSIETCKVIFMARRRSPINTFGRTCVIYEPEDLSVEEPWVRFCLKKSPSGDFSSPLKEVCKLFLSKFESLPGAILYLRNRKGRNDEWALMSPPLDILRPLNLIKQVLEILSNEDRLFCLLYLSIFPQHSLISCKRVSRLWAAEGFLPDLGEAEGLFTDLLDRKCIHPAEKRSDGELTTFRVDNFVREIIASLSPHCNWPESVRYVSVQGTITDLNEEKPFQFSSKFVPDVSSIEDKTTTSEASQLETSKTWSFPFPSKHNKVLDLTGASFQTIPKEVFDLTEARYLSLRNTSIKEIPASIGKLRHLEFLDAKHSFVTKLPHQAARLKKIRHILIYHHKKDPLMESNDLIGFKALCRIGGFKHLEKLCFVESDNITLEDLGNLRRLRRLGITKLKKEHGEMLCSSLEKLEELKSLNVHAFDEEEIIHLHRLSSPPKFLKHLYLHGRLEKLPNWILSHDGLTKIILRWSQLEEDLLATLGELRNLLELELRRAYNGKQLDFKKGQFPKLKILLLDELEALKSMSLAEETMPSLEKLTISRCRWLEKTPSGIEHIPTIRKLMFFDMSHEFYDKVRAVHEKDGYKKFKHIPEVYFTRWRAGHWEAYQVESTDETHSSHQTESTDEAQVESTDEPHSCTDEAQLASADEPHSCTDEAQLASANEPHSCTDEAQLESTDEPRSSHQMESTYEAHEEMEKSSGYDYEVFLSFRGRDMDLADYLCVRMIDAGIRVYSDNEEFRLGEEFSGELLQAIEHSKISIPIISQGYVESQWCLRELVKMVESKNTRRHKIMPIFYDVTPSELRKQTKYYDKAIVSHAKRKIFSDETINKWKAALREVGALKGWELNCSISRGKGEFVKEVVHDVFVELKNAYLEASNFSVEVPNHVSNIMRLIGAHNHETKIVGIHGIGGIGKTTLAKTVYNELFDDFDNCCFLSNVRETKITRLQNQLISSILRKQWLDIHNIMEGKSLIKQRLCSKKVLLLLDDVDHASQLDALMPKCEWIGKGSKIIITTRDCRIFEGPIVVNGIYELTRLDDKHSLQLFSKHAFRSDYPIEHYLSLSEKAIKICGGLPILLDTLGSLLSGKNSEEWETTLKELEEFSQEDVQRKLMISIQALIEDQRKDDGISFLQQETQIVGDAHGIRSTEATSLKLDELS